MKTLILCSMSFGKHFKDILLSCCTLACLQNIGLYHKCSTAIRSDKSFSNGIKIDWICLISWNHKKQRVKWLDLVHLYIGRMIYWADISIIVKLKKQIRFLPSRNFWEKSQEHLLRVLLFANQTFIVFRKCLILSK